MMKVTNPASHYKTDAELYDYFAELHPLDADSARRIQEAVYHSANISEGSTVLDIGSGNGWLLDRLQGRDNLVVSVDLGKNNLMKLKKKHGEKFHAVVADAAQLPFKSEVFDTIIASEILEHLNNPELTVRESHHILARGGKVVISTPHKEILRTYLCIHCNQQTPANAHIHSFDKKRHEDILEQQGFSAIRSELLQNKLFALSRISYLLRFLPFRIWRMVDSLCIFIVRKAHTIVVSAEKNTKE
jgi:2-polyprenyl-3-methyl-5-hydroxy-6-metoxy-1,4-benzoquinol methylase